MPIRMSGMNSGLDTASIITDLMKSQSFKKDRMHKEQSMLQYQQDSWKAMNTRINQFYNNTVGKLKYSSDFIKKATFINDESIASVSAGSNAVLGSQSLAVTQLAKSGYLTGDKITKTDGTKADKTTTMDEMGIATGSDAKFSIEVGGKITSIELKSTDTIDSLVGKLKGAGVDASYDETNKRFFISSKTSGLENDFTISADNAKGMDALGKLGILSKDDVAGNPEYIKWASYHGATDADIIVNLNNATGGSEITAEVLKRIKALEAENIKLVDDNVALAAQKVDLEAAKKTYIESPEYAKIISELNAEGITGTTDERATTLTDRIDSLEIDFARQKELAAIPVADLTQAEKDELATLESSSLEREKQFKRDSTNLAAMKKEQDYTKGIADADVEIDANDAKFTENLVAIGDGTGSSELINQVEVDLVDKVKTSKKAIDDANSGAIGGGATRIKGQDGKIILNGAEFTSKSNVFSINGLVITAQKLSEETGGAGSNKWTTTDITTSENVEGIYDVVKGFLKEYNSLMNDMSKAFNIEDPEIDPLTEEEREELSDKEVEKWEKKLKDSSLSKDETLESVLFGMNDIITQGVEINGETLYLSDFGIKPQNFLEAPEDERYAYHIDGDSDNPISSGKEDKLKAMIAKDSSAVATFFSDMATTMSTKLFRMMGATENSSTLTIYNDVSMGNDYKQYTKDIKEEEKRLKELEDKYYKDFSAMEVALSKINSSSNAMAGMFGGA